MLFEEVNSMWTEGRLTQAEAAQLPGVCKWTFRRYLAHLREEEGDGIEALQDRRLLRASHRTAPVDEVMRMVDRYRTRYAGWNVRHFYAWYRRDGGSTATTGCGPSCKRQGRCRGMLPRQNGRTHE